MHEIIKQKLDVLFPIVSCVVASVSFPSCYTSDQIKDNAKVRFTLQGTNINKALEKGIEFLQTHTETSASANPSMIIFLTDGQPTDGTTNKAKIIQNVRNKNDGKFTIFTLGFGKGVDMKFLERIALENNGFSRRIYEEAHSDLQLKGFFSEVSLPLLTNISIEYDSNKVDTNSVTLSNYPYLFDGSEVVVAGQLVSNDISNFISSVDAVSKNGLRNFDLNVDVKKTDTTFPSIKEFGKFTKRLWAYLTIKQMLRKALITQDIVAREKLNNRSLELSLKVTFHISNFPV